MALPLARFLNAVYVWCLERIAGDDIEKFMYEMNKPIVGAPVTTAVVEQEMDEFAAFASAFGVTPPLRG